MYWYWLCEGEMNFWDGSVVDFDKISWCWVYFEIFVECKCRVNGFRSCLWDVSKGILCSV